MILSYVTRLLGYVMANEVKPSYYVSRVYRMRWLHFVRHDVAQADSIGFPFRVTSEEPSALARRTREMQMNLLVNYTLSKAGQHTWQGSGD
jgi:hypothetical protein